MKASAVILDFFRFWLGVFGWIFYGFRQLIRWLAYEEGLIEHFCQRFVAVEKRLRGSRHLTFIYRYLRYAVHHYHLIPPWVKILKVVILLGLMVGHPLWQKYQNTRESDHYYSFYYQHGLEHYRKYLPEAEAEKVAADYARKFADYYTSASYKEALRTALPVTPTPQLQQAARQAPPAVRELKMAEVGLDLVKHFEGLRLKPYRDPVGKFTIGYGHLMRPGEAFAQISQAKAHELLLRDVAIAELLVKQHVKVPLTTSQFSALVALVYNIGGYQFRTSTLLRTINAGDYLRAAEEIRRWEMAGGKTLPGLTRRRYAEYLLFTGKWQSKS